MANDDLSGVVAGRTVTTTKATTKADDACPHGGAHLPVQGSQSGTRIIHSAATPVVTADSLVLERFRYQECRVVNVRIQSRHDSRKQRRHPASEP